MGAAQQSPVQSQATPTKESQAPEIQGGAMSQTRQNAVGNAAVQAALATQAGASAPKVLPKPLPHMVGNVNYYKERNADYLRRHSSPPPPDYYMAYGDKYARRFTTILRPTLSKAGQAWLDKAFIVLQNAMENRLVKDSAAYDALEMNGDAFRTFAYGTHPDAYLAGGLSKLGPSDLAKIATTPDLGDLATLDGVSQILETGVRLLPQWGGQAADAVGGAASAGWDATKRGAGAVAGAAKRGAGAVADRLYETLAPYDWATDW